MLLATISPIIGRFPRSLPDVRRYAVLQLRVVSDYVGVNEVNKIRIALKKVAEQDPLARIRKEAQKGLKKIEQREGQEKKIAFGPDCHPEELKKIR